MDGISILFMGLIFLAALALLFGLAMGISGYPDPKARGGCGTLLLVCLAMGWALFFGLIWLGHYDDDEIPGTYTLVARKADNAYIAVPNCHLVLTSQGIYRFDGNCRPFGQCREGQYWVQLADEDNYGVNFLCGGKRHSALFNQSSIGEPYVITFGGPAPDSTTALFYSFRRD